MTRHHSDRNLLFGILALQMDFVTRDGLIAGMNAWILEKHRPIGEVLVERGDLDPRARDLLDPMVDLHVARHGGDPGASLAALSSADGIAADLRRRVFDPEVLDSLATIAPGLGDDLDATRAVIPPPPPAGSARFRKLREHAAGNLGVVYVARDQELNREVALKEIKERNADHDHHQAKFLLEAEVTGGLEHPGIVPVYGLGHHEDGRPYYAMRFIRGRSLLDAIRQFHADEPLEFDRGRRALALQKLLRRFTDVCNAVAYAHSRGILHRDLKPANVMVGKYGETLVVDWGLAKALGRPDESSGLIEDPDDHPPETSLQPSTADGLEATLAGTLVGTPAYMSPEQATGRLDLLGPASDVYGLGATLYHLLTGHPPIESGGLGEILARVQAGEIPRPRDLAPWLDPALEAVCLKAMALESGDRYASPRALADDLDRWIAGEPVAAYPEPWNRRARRWAAKHRTGLATAASAATVAALALGGLHAMRVAQGRRAEDAARLALRQAEGMAATARATGDLSPWEKAIAEAVRAQDQLESGGGGSELSRQVSERLAAYRAEEAARRSDLEAQGRDQRMVAALEEARLRASNFKDGEFDIDAKLEAFSAAFREYGMDLATLPVEDAARRIRSSRVADHLIAALDDWADYEAPAIPASRLKQLARAAEVDPDRAAIRDAVDRRDVAALRRICEKEQTRRGLGPRLRSAFEALLSLDPERSLALLEAIRHEHPDDFWFNHDLGEAYYQDVKPPRFHEAIRCLTVAVALRPKSPGAYIALGFALRKQGEIDRAVTEFREALRLKPDDAEVHFGLGLALNDQEKYDEATTEFLEALRIDPGHARAHNGLANALSERGEVDRAIAEYREAIRLDPEFAFPHSNLGLVLSERGEVDRAIAEFREAIRLDPEDARSHIRLGDALDERGKVDEAIAEYREAIRLDPDIALAHFNLGVALAKQGKIDQAIAAYREAIRLDPKDADPHCNLGNILNDRGKTEQAVAEYREAIRLDPEDALPHYNLGLVLDRRGKAEPAIAEYREAIRLKPDHEWAYLNLGLLLGRRGLFPDALALLERGHELGSRKPGWKAPSAEWVREARRDLERESKLLAIGKGEASPRDAAERLELAKVCYKIGRHAMAVRFADEAFAEKPELAEDLEKAARYNAACSAALAGSGQGQDIPPADAPARTRLREKALAWLRADLNSRTEQLHSGGEPARQAVLKKLAHWKDDPDLAGIRDEVALASLPMTEREAFRSLWADVEALRKEAEGGRDQ